MRYVDSNGNRYEKTSKQDQLLDWMYNHTIGRMLLKVLINPLLSKAGGMLLNTKLSAVLIRPFIRANGIQMKDYETKHYKSYNDFFTRKIRPEKRPIIEDYDWMISPSDGKVTAYPIDEQLVFKVKNTWYSVKSLLKNPLLAAAYRGGTCVIIRLTVDDYHRYCYVDGGHKGRNHAVPGALHTVNPVANDFVPIFKENAREYTTLFTDNFGAITQVEVGALMVGKITNCHKDAALFRKGQEKGYFEFGGSTIILLIEKDSVDILPSLFENTKLGYETVVKMGEPIGKKYTHLSKCKCR